MGSVSLTVIPLGYHTCMPSDSLQPIELALAKSNALFRQMFDLLPAGAIVHAQGRILATNAAALAILEADRPDQVVGHTVMEFVHPLDQARVRDRLEGMAPDQRPNDPAEIRVLTCRHELRVLGMTTMRFEYRKSAAYVTVAIDLSKRFAMEAKLRESEENFRRLFENMADVYYRTDKNGIVLMVGPGVRKVLGYEPEEIIGQQTEKFYPRPEDRDPLKQALREKGEVMDFPGQMVRKDGRIIDISINTRALYDARGEFAGVEGVYRDITERKMLERELMRLATTDPLTGIANRRAFLGQAQDALSRCERYSGRLALALLDMDHFKGINDRYGHAMGDEVLVRAVQAVQQELRETDLFGRLGGEEFCIALLEADKADAMAVAERICARVEALRFLHEGQGFSVSVSIGTTAYRRGDRLEQLMERADRALYAAKEAGRNCAIWHEAA